MEEGERNLNPGLRETPNNPDARESRHVLANGYQRMIELKLSFKIKPQILESCEKGCNRSGPNPGCKITKK